MQQTKGVLRILGREGCPIGEVRMAYDKKCHKVLKAHPLSHEFNVRRKDGRIISSTITGAKNTFSGILQVAKDQRVPVQVTFEQVIWDSQKNRPLEGKYIFRNADVVKTGYVP